MTAPHDTGSTGVPRPPIAGRRSTPRRTMPADQRYELILKVAQQLFFARGYDAVSMRDIAAAAGLRVPSLYHYFDGKERILHVLMLRGMTTLTERTADAITCAERAGGSAAERLRAAIVANVRYHVEHHALAGLTSTERRSLSPEIYALVLPSMKAYEQIFIRLLEDGVAADEFQVEDPRMAAFLILTACGRISTWFREGGHLTGEDLARLYSEMLLRSVTGCR